MGNKSKFKTHEHVYCYLDGYIFDGEITDIYVESRLDEFKTVHENVKYTVNNKEIDENFIFSTEEELENSGLIPDGMIDIKEIWCNGKRNFEKKKNSLEKIGYEFVSMYHFDNYIILRMKKCFKNNKMNNISVRKYTEDIFKSPTFTRGMDIDGADENSSGYFMNLDQKGTLSKQEEPVGYFEHKYTLSIISVYEKIGWFKRFMIDWCFGLKYYEYGKK